MAERDTSSSSVVDGITASLIPNIYKCQVSYFIWTPLEKGDTYLFWKEQMENLFRIHRVSKIIRENQIIPPERNSDGMGQRILVTKLDYRRIRSFLAGFSR